MGYMKQKSQTQLLEELREATPKLYTITVASAQAEYPQGLPANCGALQFQCRTENTVRYAFEAGKVPSGGTAPYSTLKAGDVWYKESLNLAAATLYIGADTAALIVEAEAWS